MDSKLVEVFPGQDEASLIVFTVPLPNFICSRVQDQIQDLQVEIQDLKRQNVWAQKEKKLEQRQKEVEHRQIAQEFQNLRTEINSLRQVCFHIQMSLLALNAHY
jgi:cell fate (sporulation/competence/biofilm development) regulator YmcA (YheA/YmcA/DUF963 family)